MTVEGEDGLISDPVSIGFDTNDRFLIGPQSVVSPSGLRAEIYSSSALELFWDRVNDVALEYEIRQDGSSLGFTNGTSFFINSGIGGKINYLFDVYAVQQNNPGISISEPASIRVNIDERSSTAEPPLSSPANVSIISYSSTAAELFWDRPAAAERIAGTDIFRNGERLSTVPGPSFYDNTRVSNTSYTYELVAINNAGERSDVTTLIDGMPSEPPASELMVDESNLEEFVSEIARIISGNVYNDLVTKAVSIAVLEAQGLEFVSQSNVFNGATVTEVYACEGGGQLTRSFPISSGLFSNNIDLNDCTLGSDTFDGALRYESSAFGQELTMNALQRSYDSGDTTTITGSLIKPGSLEVRSLAVSQYVENNADGSERPVTDYRTTAIDVAEDDRPGVASALFSSWTASGPFSNNLTVVASTPIEFDRATTDRDFTRGTLLLEIEGVLKMTLNADNGDPESFQVDVEQNGSVNSYTVNWTDSNRMQLVVELI